MIQILASAPCSYAILFEYKLVRDGHPYIIGKSYPHLLKDNSQVAKILVYSDVLGEIRINTTRSFEGFAPTRANTSGAGERARKATPQSQLWV